MIIGICLLGFLWGGNEKPSNEDIAAHVKKAADVFDIKVTKSEFTEMTQWQGTTLPKGSWQASTLIVGVLNQDLYLPLVNGGKYPVFSSPRPIDVGLSNLVMRYRSEQARPINGNDYEGVYYEYRKDYVFPDLIRFPPIVEVFKKRGYERQGKVNILAIKEVDGWKMEILDLEWKEDGNWFGVLKEVSTNSVVLGSSEYEAQIKTVEDSMRAREAVWKRWVDFTNAAMQKASTEIQPYVAPGSVWEDVMRFLEKDVEKEQQNVRIVWEGVEGGNFVGTMECPEQGDQIKLIGKLQWQPDKRAKNLYNNDAVTMTFASNSFCGLILIAAKQSEVQRRGILINLVGTGMFNITMKQWKPTLQLRVGDIKSKPKK